jgi:ATP-dependent Clp protease ATP-binding subunit ClpA
LAQEEARLLNHHYIGTEHILLGLIHEGDGVPAQALERCGISLEAVRNEVEGRVGVGPSEYERAGSKRKRRLTTNGPAQTRGPGSPPFTPRAKKVLELSLRESTQLGHLYIGTEHLLLGLIQEGEGMAAQILQSLDVDLVRLRQEVVELLPGSLEGTGSRQESAAARADPPRCSRCDAWLLETARYQVIAVRAQDPESDDAVLSVPVVYCNRCGTAAWRRTACSLAQNRAREGGDSSGRLTGTPTVLPRESFGTNGPSLLGRAGASTG